MNQRELLSVKWYPLGDAAIVVQFGDRISEDIHAKIRAFARVLENGPFPGMIEYVPAFTTVTIYYDPWIVSEKGKLAPYPTVAHCIQELVDRMEVHAVPNPRIMEIPVCYGGEYGPDLEWVAGHNQMTPEEVIAIHSRSAYLVYLIGFAPGFPYLGGMDERIAAPRRETPRQVIPAGSVGIAGTQTGIYPIETPGGWQLIGRTSLSLFNPCRQPASLLQMGDLVRFVPITPQSFRAGKEA